MTRSDLTCSLNLNKGISLLDLSRDLGIHLLVLISIRGRVTHLVDPIRDLVTRRLTEIVLTRIGEGSGFRGRGYLVTPLPHPSITSLLLHIAEVTPADPTPGAVTAHLDMDPLDILGTHLQVTALQVTALLVTARRLPEVSPSPLLDPRPGSTVTPACLHPGCRDLGRDPDPECSIPDFK